MRDNESTLGQRKYKSVYLCCLPQGKIKVNLYSTYYKGKYKSTIGVFLHDLYSKQLLMNSDTQKLFGQMGPLQNLSIN